jgi:hypothetical protein
LALVDLLAEFSRQDKGLRPMPKKKMPADPLTPIFSPPGEDTGISAPGHNPRLSATRKVGPARAFLDSLGIGAKSLKEVARELDVSPNTLRKLLEHPDLTAPSYTADWGSRTIYVYTPDDVQELRSFFAKQRSVEGLRKRKP